MLGAVEERTLRLQLEAKDQRIWELEDKIEQLRGELVDYAELRELLRRVLKEDRHG